jgi:hypothetical protein
MKKTVMSIMGMLVLGTSFSQETPDTTKFKVGGKEVIIISPKETIVIADSTMEMNDTLDAAPDPKDLESIEAHWSGIEFGPTLLLNDAMKASFPNDPQWENDPGKSFSWNVNVLEHKFPIYKNYIGITTGLGFNWTQIGLKQYVLTSTTDSLMVTTDSINDFAKNKLRAIYLTAPLMLEICSSKDGDKGLYLAAGVIGGVRIGSSVKTVIDTEKKQVEGKDRGTYGLNAFRLDAAVKMGYENWGVFANYNVLPLFDTDKTAAVYPLTFGLSYNF